MTAGDLPSQPVPVATRPAVARSVGPKSTTRKTLWTLCIVLLVVTTTVFGTSLWVFQNVHDTVETVRNSTAPAIIEVLAAQAALVEADTAAIDSFRNGEAQLTGPGQQYQNQLAFASQSLAQVAEDNAAGDPGSQTIQLVEALLVSYSGLIGQADANFRQGQGTTLGMTDLWYASRLLRTNPDSGILVQLDALLKSQTDALNGQILASSMTVWTVLVWVLPIVVLFVLLGVTQVFLRRRFRRTLNPLLLLATVLLVGLCIVTSLAFVSQNRLEDSRETLKQLVGVWSAQTSATDTRRQRALTDLVAKECQRAGDSCGATVTRFAPNPEPEDTVNEIKIPDRTMNVKKQIEAAGRDRVLWPLIPLLTALIAVLIPLGLRPRIEEYRYRPR